jgi:resuscitation-promoting factor RpfB
MTRAIGYRRRARRVMRRWMRRRDRRNFVLAALAGLALAAAVHAAGSGTSAPAVPAQAAAAPAVVAGNVARGQQLAAGDGWGSGPQWNCLYALWQRESSWSNTAENPRSGAYGIAQALGHGPTGQYPAGPANPPVSDPSAQVRWGLGYIAGTYGTPCAAWAHEEADSWY